MADLLNNPWLILGAVVALIVMPRLSKIQLASLWAKMNPADDTTPTPDAPHGPLELREHWRCLRAACEAAGETEAVDALDGDVAGALGRLYIRPEVNP